MKAVSRNNYTIEKIDFTEFFLKDPTQLLLVEKLGLNSKFFTFPLRLGLA